MDWLILVYIIEIEDLPFNFVDLQAEESEIEEQIKEIEYAVDHVKSILSRLFIILLFLMLLFPLLF